MRNAVAVVLLLALVGCGHAVMVRRDARGGTLALRGPSFGRDRQMREAREKMAAHCGGAYRVVSEENVAAGTVAETTTSYGVTQTTTRNRTEYRLTYECAASQGATQQP